MNKMANKPEITLADILTGMLDHVSGAVKMKMTSGQYLKHRDGPRPR